MAPSLDRWSRWPMSCSSALLPALLASSAGQHSKHLFLSFVYCRAGVEPKASHMLGLWSAAELPPALGVASARSLSCS